MQDVVLDLLKEKNSQTQVLCAYRESNEPEYVQQAVLESWTDNVTFPHYAQR